MSGFVAFITNRYTARNDINMLAMIIHDHTGFALEAIAVA